MPKKGKKFKAKVSKRLAKSSKAILLSRLGINAKDLNLVKEAKIKKKETKTK